MQGPLYIKSAGERYPEYFEITDTVISQLDLWVHRGGMKRATTALSFVKIATIIRAFNIYKSLNLLLKTNHWEDAVTIARSLFELLLHIEEVVRDEKDAEKKAKKYLRFSKLQEYLHLASEINYEIETGRCSKKRDLLLKELNKASEFLFQEFRNEHTWSGWDNTWCGKSVYKLAVASKNPMRIHHYKIIYPYFSDLSHSSPYSTMTTMTNGKLGDTDDAIVERREDMERKNLTTVLMLSTVWLMEVLFLAQSEIPSYDIRWNLKVLRRVYKTFGVKPPEDISKVNI